VQNLQFTGQSIVEGHPRKEVETILANYFRQTFKKNDLKIEFVVPRSEN